MINNKSKYFFSLKFTLIFVNLQCYVITIFKFLKCHLTNSISSRILNTEFDIIRFVWFGTWGTQNYYITLWKISSSRWVSWEKFQALQLLSWFYFDCGRILLSSNLRLKLAGQAKLSNRINVQMYKIEDFDCMCVVENCSVTQPTIGCQFPVVHSEMSLMPFSTPS